MNNTPDISITTYTTLPEVLKTMKAQWSYKEIVEGIIDFCCDQDTNTFEELLMAALIKFKEENQ